MAYIFHNNNVIKTCHKNLKQKLAMQVFVKYPILFLIAHMLALQFILMHESFFASKICYLHCFTLMQVLTKLTTSFFAYNLHYKQVSQRNTIRYQQIRRIHHQSLFRVFII